MEPKDRSQKAAQDATSSTEEQVRADQQIAREKFAEPRGWALKWDGFALGGAPERRGRHAPADKGTSR